MIKPSELKQMSGEAVEALAAERKRKAEEERKREEEEEKYIREYTVPQTLEDIQGTMKAAARLSKTSCRYRVEKSGRGYLISLLALEELKKEGYTAEIETERETKYENHLDEYGEVEIIYIIKVSW